MIKHGCFAVGSSWLIIYSLTVVFPRRFGLRFLSLWIKRLGKILNRLPGGGSAIIRMKS